MSAALIVFAFTHKERGGEVEREKEEGAASSSFME